jgi:hypothetical protein
VEGRERGDPVQSIPMSPEYAAKWEQVDWGMCAGGLEVLNNESASYLMCNKQLETSDTILDLNF